MEKKYTILRDESSLRNELILSPIRKEILEYFNNLIFNNSEYSSIAFNNTNVKVYNGVLVPKDDFIQVVKSKKFTLRFQKFNGASESVFIEFDIDETIESFFNELNLGIFSLTATSEHSRTDILSLFNNIQNSKISEKCYMYYVEDFHNYTHLYPTFNFDMDIKKFKSLIEV